MSKESGAGSIALLLGPILVILVVGIYVVTRAHLKPPPLVASASATAGKTAELASITTNNVYELAAVKKAAAARSDDTNRCYEASEHDPVDHQFVSFAVVVDSAGKVATVGPVGSAARSAALDLCMGKVLRSLELGAPGNGEGGAMTIAFTSRAP
jgi:hypothetical protein